ncbi:MAG TPA: ABC transporter permease [Stellaceae bacterium]|nr:ABC transporter permease [Stellaceae bacterium]
MLSQSWAIQRRVWGAIMMREIQTRWGRRNLGFGWLFAEPLVFAFPVIGMWSLIRSPIVHGIPLMPLIWSGYLPLLVFRHVTGNALYVVRTNSALLYHRSVTPLDIIIGRCGLETIGNLGAVASSFFILYFLGFLDWPANVPLFIAGNLFMAWWALAVALLVAATCERTDIVEHVWPVLSYMYLPVSGFWFLAAWLPTPIRHVALAVMPSLHAYEMIRAGLLGNRIQTYYDPIYLSYYLAVVTLLGLWSVRGIRQHLELIE